MNFTFIGFGAICWTSFDTDKNLKLLGALISQKESLKVSSDPI